MHVLDVNKTHQKYFEAICNIPHPSTQEKAVSDYVCSVAESLNLEYEQDELWNVIVRKPASAGYENAPVVMLQAHMDMVCVKSPDSNHIFETDPLQLFVDENNNVRAKGTTLGADDGYGCAYLLALMEENDYPHPPLELVFTSQEENGCWGAAALDVSKLKAKRMIGLDVLGETYEWVSTVSCFSSDLIIVTKESERISCSEKAIKVKISGIQPIYSESMVHPEQFNAIKIAARLLYTLRVAGVSYKLSSMNGGVAENYPPVECDFEISLSEIEKAKEILSDEFKIITIELDDGEQEFCFTLEETTVSSVISEKDTADIINLLYLMPSNYFSVKPKTGELTSTNNVGKVEFCSDRDFTLTMSNRN
ncbi:MAG: M20/M25/M40 family metallo-hydrolase, partial [Clostridia bacterium]|nr:M20/M25/M40 family metallo-hydrolase [Clostridia bacterium]